MYSKLPERELTIVQIVQQFWVDVQVHELLGQLLHLGRQYLILIDSAVSHLLQIIQSYTSTKTLKYYLK